MQLDSSMTTELTGLLPILWSHQQRPTASTEHEVGVVEERLPSINGRREVAGNDERRGAA